MTNPEPSYLLIKQFRSLIYAKRVCWRAEKSVGPFAEKKVKWEWQEVGAIPEPTKCTSPNVSCPSIAFSTQSFRAGPASMWSAVLTWPFLPSGLLPHRRVVLARRLMAISVHLVWRATWLIDVGMATRPLQHPVHMHSHGKP